MAIRCLDVNNILILRENKLNIQLECNNKVSLDNNNTSDDENEPGTQIASSIRKFLVP